MAISWQGGTFKIKDLSRGDISTLKLPELVCCEFKEEKELLYKEKTYWKPKDQNYPAIDSAISLASCGKWDACALQMTVNYNHGVIRHYIEMLLKQFCIIPDHSEVRKRILPLFFVVPPDKFKDFAAQTYLTSRLEPTKSSRNLVNVCVKQFALEISFGKSA